MNTYANGYVMLYFCFTALRHAVSDELPC